MYKDFCLRWIDIDVSAAAKQLKAGFCFNTTEIFSIQTGEMRDALGIKTFMGFLHDIRMSFVQERVQTGCYIITSVKFIRNEAFLSEFIGVFFTERNTHSGRSFYLYNVNAVRLWHLYESSVGAREALKKTERDIKTCFYRLIIL